MDGTIKTIPESRTIFPNWRWTGEVMKVARNNWAKQWRERGRPHTAVIGGCIGLIVFVWTFAFWVVDNDRRTNLMAVEREQDQLTQAFAAHLQQSLHEIDQHLQLIKLEYERAGAVTPGIRMIFAETLANPQTNQSFIADNNGNVVAFAVAHPFINVLDRSYFQEHASSVRDGLIVSEPFPGRSTGKTGVVLSRRINKRDGSFGGVVAIAINPDYFCRFYTDMKLGSHRIVRVVGTDGIVRASRDPTISGPGQSLIGTQLMKEVERAHFGQFKSAGAFGVIRYYTYRVLADYPLLVQVGIDARAATAETDECRTLYLKTAGIVSLFLLAFAAFFIRCSHVRRQMEKAARKREQELARDVSFASKVQVALLPVTPESEFFRMQTLFRPLALVSGDIYYTEWLENAQVLRGYLIDVTGHGVAAALQMAAVNVLLHEIAASPMTVSVAEQLSWLNRRVGVYFEEAAFAAGIVFEVDFAAGELRYASAGITEFLFNDQWLPAPGLLLGVDELETYETQVLTIVPGDTVCFVTDGITDVLATEEEGKATAAPNLCRLFEAGAYAEKLRDDATAVCIEILKLADTMKI